MNIETIESHELTKITGGAAATPEERQQVIQNACGPQLDNLTTAQKAAHDAPWDARAQLGVDTARGSLARCIGNTGEVIPPSFLPPRGGAR